MSALQKLKAYFGMIPAESDEYDEYDGADDYRRTYADEGYDAYEEEPRQTRRHRSDYDTEPVPRTRGREPAVHGALAVDRQPEPIARLRSVSEESRMTAHRDPLSRITTLHPKSFMEARAIGEAYRD